MAAASCDPNQLTTILPASVFMKQIFLCMLTFRSLFLLCSRGRPSASVRRPMLPILGSPQEQRPSGAWGLALGLEVP